MQLQVGLRLPRLGTGGQAGVRVLWPDVSSWYTLPSTRSRGAGTQHLSPFQSWRRHWGLFAPLSITKCKLSAADPPGAMVGLGEAA